MKYDIKLEHPYFYLWPALCWSYQGEYSWTPSVRPLDLHPLHDQLPHLLQVEVSQHPTHLRVQSEGPGVFGSALNRNRNQLDKVEVNDKYSFIFNMRFSFS